MSRFISKDTVAELTGKKTYKAQVRILRELGFVVLWIEGQPPKVTVDHFAKMTGSGVQSEAKHEAKLNFDQL